MRPIFTIDCETDPFRHGRFPQPFLWGIYDGATYHCFDRTSDVVDFLRDTRGIFYAHNGGRFDYYFLLDYAEDYTETLIINGRLAKWRLGDAELRDSYNILPIPLKAYKKDEFDYSLMERGERDKRAVRGKIETYLKHDCMYLHDLVTKFVETYGLHLTQASAGMNLWKKQCGHEVPATDSLFYDFLKPFYFGGRVQAFRTGVARCNFRGADVKSAYPRAMLEAHPFGDSIEPVRRRVIEGKYFYRVRCVANGCFPYRGEDNRLHYYVDNIRRTYSVTGWEVIAALELNLLKDVEIEGIWKVSGSLDFRDYILPLWEDRKDAERVGDDARKLFDKLLMNSLYGKFGADPRKYFNHFIMPSESAPLDSPEYELAGYIGKWALMRDTEAAVWSKFYCVATSASICGYQRAIMMRQLARCRGLIYCDTDFIAAEHLGELDEGGELGQWEVDKYLYDWYAIGGRKLYAFRSGRYYKSASKGARLSIDQIRRVALGESVLYEPDVPTYSLHNPVRFIDREISLVED